MMMTTTTIKAKVDQKVPPGALISATITIGGNGGCTVMYDHSPSGKAKMNQCMPWEPRRPDVFASIEEAAHAIVQAAGGNSEYEESEESK